MKSVRKSYTFQNLLTNKTLLPAEKLEILTDLLKSGNINWYQQTALLKIIYDFRTEISFKDK